MIVSVSGTIDQKTYLKKFKGASAPLAPLDPRMVFVIRICIHCNVSTNVLRII